MTLDYVIGSGYQVFDLPQITIQPEECLGTFVELYIKSVEAVGHSTFLVLSSFTVDSQQGTLAIDTENILLTDKAYLVVIRAKDKLIDS